MLALAVPTILATITVEQPDDNLQPIALTAAETRRLFMPSSSPDHFHHNTLHWSTWR
jgi:hypothetical protein